MDFKATGDKIRLLLSDLEELKLDAYENAKLYKEKTKKWHDKRIMKMKYKVGWFVLLFNSRFKLFHGKLHSRLSKNFDVMRVTSFGAIEVWIKSTRPFTIN